MEDVNISIYRASVVREGSTPASPGFVVSDGQNPVDPSGSGQNHLPVTIAEAATGLSITESQVLGGAGTVGQYIRGDGSLADFPESSGGGSSVSYYLNGSVAQGTIGGVAYKELNKVPILGAGTDFTINADGYIASFITDAGDPNLLEIPGGNWNFETYFSSSSSGGTPSFYVELYKYDGSTFTLLASNSSFPEFIAFGTIITPYFSTLAVPTTTLALTDRLAIRYYVTHSGRTITLHTEDNHLCQVVTTFTTGLTALNGLTAQIQNFAVGTSGTDFAISSATATHTFNLPTASATNRGALSSTDWTTFNNKTSNLGTVTSVGLSSATSGVTIGSTPVTTSGTITLAIATASGSQNGLLSSTDWTTFNNKQNALTNPVTGTGTTNYLPKFTGASTIGNSLFTDDGTNGAFGGANYSVGTSVRTFNISAPLYAGIGFWANNVYTSDIFSYTVSGNIIISADPTNTLTDSRVILATDGTQRLSVFDDGNVTIANNPTNSGFKLYVAAPSTAIAAFAGATNAYVDISDGTVNSRLQNTAQGFLIGTVNSYNLNLRTNGTIRATIDASSGIAAFFSTSSGGQNLRMQTSIAAGRNYIQWANPSGDMGYIGYGGADNKFYISNQLNADMLFATNNATRLTLEASTGAATFTSGIATSGYTATASYAALFSGNVGILTPTPNGRLAIRAQISNTPSLLFQNGLGGPSSAISNYESSAQTYTLIGTNLYVNNAAGFSRFDTNKQSSGVAFDEGTLILATGPTGATASNRFMVTPDGYARLSASSGGLQFNGDTAAANALDDYEEGTWTPTWSSSGGTINTNSSLTIGRYTKIGNVVHVWSRLYTNSVSSPTGIVTVSGLPFTVNSSPSNGAMHLFTMNAITGTLTGTPVIFFEPGTSIAKILNKIWNSTEFSGDIASYFDNDTWGYFHASYFI